MTNIKRCFETSTDEIPVLGKSTCSENHKTIKIWKSESEIWGDNIFPDKTHSVCRCSPRWCIMLPRVWYTGMSSSLVFTLFNLFESDNWCVTSPHTPPDSDGPLFSPGATHSQLPQADSPTSYSSQGIVWGEPSETISLCRTRKGGEKSQQDAFRRKRDDHKPFSSHF